MLLRECDCAENPGTPSCEECGQRQVQRSGDGLRPSRIPAGGPLDPGITPAIDASRGGGRPLEHTARQRLEQGLGEPLGDVRVHADAHAATLAHAVSARAFAVGSDLFFAAGAYRPGSRDGDKLIAHEVTHAVQQRGAPASGPLTVSAPADAAEVEAEAMASTVQAEASMYSPKGAASAGGHEPARTAGTMGAIRAAAMSIARTVDPTSDDYQRGYNDGRAANPAAPGPLSPDALDDYNEGYQKGQAEAGVAQASLPPAGPESTASPAADSAAPAPISAPASAPTVDPTSDDYQRGYNDGRAANPAAPGPLSPDALDDYNEGYQNGKAQADAAQASLPPATAAPDSTASPTPDSASTPGPLVADGGASSLSSGTTPAPLPPSLRAQIGTLNYYRMRNDDFLARHPGGTPPDYYLGYGDKYVHLFSTVLRPKLSVRGREWLDCTLVALQTAIEDRLDADPAAFARLEEQGPVFRHFAYGTHPGAYVGCGICSGFVDDDVQILMTPDWSDILGAEGREQIGVALNACLARWNNPWWWAFGK